MPPKESKAKAKSQRKAAIKLDQEVLQDYFKQGKKKMSKSPEESKDATFEPLIPRDTNKEGIILDH